MKGKCNRLAAIRHSMRERFGKLFKSCLAEGISPRRLALTLSLGAAIGMLPTVWGSTLLCVLVAFRLKLNQAVIQAANYLVYPVQVALFLPFYRVGARLFPWGPAVSLEALERGFSQGWMGNVSLLVVATLKALAAWLIIAPPLVALLYFLVLAILRRVLANQEMSRDDHGTDQRD